MTGAYRERGMSPHPAAAVAPRKDRARQTTDPGPAGHHQAKSASHQREEASMSVIFSGQGRAEASVAVVLGLISLGLGGLALARLAGRFGWGSAPVTATVAAVAG